MGSEVCSCRVPYLKGKENVGTSLKMKTYGNLHVNLGVLIITVKEKNIGLEYGLRQYFLGGRFSPLSECSGSTGSTGSTHPETLERLAASQKEKHSLAPHGQQRNELPDLNPSAPGTGGSIQHAGGGEVYTKECPVVTRPVSLSSQTLRFFVVSTAVHVRLLLCRPLPHSEVRRVLPHTTA